MEIPPPRPLLCARSAASAVAQLTELSERSVITIFGKIRCRIAEECERQSPFRNGEVEVDESYFGPHRVRGKRGRGASGKTIVFGLFKRDDRVYTEIVTDCKKATLQAIIRGRVSADAVIHSDGWRGYDGLVDVGYSKHFRVNHGKDEFANGTSHINGIESFWSYAKRRLQKFNGVPAETFHLHLKECEWRFNHRHDNLYQALLRLLRRHPSLGLIYIVRKFGVGLKFTFECCPFTHEEWALDCPSEFTFPDLVKG